MLEQTGLLLNSSQQPCKNATEPTVLLIIFCLPAGSPLSRTPSSGGHWEHKVPKRLGTGQAEGLHGIFCLFFTWQGYKLRQSLQSEDNRAAIVTNPFTGPKSGIRCCARSGPLEPRSHNSRRRETNEVAVSRGPGTGVLIWPHDGKLCSPNRRMRKCLRPDLENSL